MQMIQSEDRGPSEHRGSEGDLSVGQSIRGYELVQFPTQVGKILSAAAPYQPIVLVEAKSRLRHECFS